MSDITEALNQHCGRGYNKGVDESAMVYYNKYLSTWGESEVAELLNLMGDTEFIGDLNLPKAEARMRKLSIYLKDKVSNVYLKRGLDLMSNFPEGKLYKIHNTTEFQDVLRHVSMGN
jgi:hypothetical protein